MAQAGLVSPLPDTYYVAQGTGSKGVTEGKGALHNRGKNCQSHVQQLRNLCPY